MEGVDVGDIQSPGKYTVTPPPDLNEAAERQLFLEYDFPFLTVREVATTQASEREIHEVHVQVGRWEENHPNIDGVVGFGHSGYQFNRASSPATHGYHHQFVPDFSYIDEFTCSHLSHNERGLAYKPCVPAVVIELMSSVDVTFEDVETKMSRFMDAGTREGVIVDTRSNRVWIYNQGQRPLSTSLAQIEFEAWPGFTLDTIAIRAARERAGLL